MGTRAVVVFAARETVSVLLRTLNSALYATRPDVDRIEVLVNGNRALADSALEQLESDHSLKGRTGIRLWFIPMGDKANAWNAYLHQIWSGEWLAFFIDGYARPHADALDKLSSTMVEAPQALGGTGVPTSGRSAESIRRDLVEWGGLHGNLCCIRGSAIQDLRTRGIRIPVGHYRCDALISSILYFGCDPAVAGWDFGRVVTCASATWDVDPPVWWNLSTVSAILSRRMRQARGEIENAASKELLDSRRRPPTEMPHSSNEWILEWAHRCPDAASDLMNRSILIRRAMTMVRRAPTVPLGDPNPTLLWTGGAAAIGFKVR